MSKISQLGPLLADETATNDLYVTVNIALGEDGTKNITRRELVKSIQQEVFTNIKVNGGDYIQNIPLTTVDINTSLIRNSTINTSIMNDSTINDAIINDPIINDPDINIAEQFTPNIGDDDYFYLKDVSLDKTVAISYSELYTEIATTAKKANKVYVAIDGNDEHAGSYLKPVATIEKALEMAWASSYIGINTAISVFPGDHYTNGNLALPDKCTIVSTNGQYATKMIMNPGYEKENCFLIGSGCYIQGFSFFNLVVDNFDYPSKGFAFAFRPGARFVRSPYLRDCSQISNYFSDEITPLLNPVNSRGTSDDLGFELTIEDVNFPNKFQVGDKIETENGVEGFISRATEIASGIIYVRNNTGDFEANTVITTSTGGSARIIVVGEEDFPNKDVGRGGGMILADRAVVDPDSIFTYILSFGATPRTQNGLGYVARNGAGINGISSLSIFARCAFYALDGGQITLNNSGTQFGDISMRARGSIPVFNPRESVATIEANTEVSATLIQNANTIIDDLITNYISANTASGGLDLQLYDSVKCKRDTGYILDGVGYDLVLGTNYWAIVNGIAYRRGASQVVVDEQLVETSGAIGYLKDNVAELLDNTESIIRTDLAFDEIIDILENGVLSANTITFSSTGNTNFDKAKDILIENKALIQTGLISWINSTYPSLDYDEAICTRDTGYIIDGLSHDLNYDCNIATILNAEAYFEGTSSQLPEEQRLPTAAAIGQLGVICASVILGTYSGQTTVSGVATAYESTKAIELTNIIKNVIKTNSLGALPARREPNLDWVDPAFVNSRNLIEADKIKLQNATVGFVNSEYNFIDGNLTRRDANNLLKSISNDFKVGRQTGTRIFTAGLFDYSGQPTFSVFNPNRLGLKYIGSFEFTTPPGLTYEINDACIVYAGNNVYDGTVYYWDGSGWVSDGANDISLLNAFIGSWEHMRDFINDNLSFTVGQQNMITALFDDVLIESVRNPRVLRFGSLVESLSHQFNLASAGVNVNALPLNFRRLGQPISAAASVSQELGGRVRWSGADELNNQYFANGLKINGRTGRLEGRPFTTSVRKLARRASNSRASI
jgi:hypothetical protein